MSFRRSILLLLCCALAGCRPGLARKGDEQKEPYFLAGKNRLQDRDYAGAISMFEKALDVNPRSASAHFELGILYEQQQTDYASALYHYQKAVSLRADLISADLARQRIEECKRELAKSVTMPLSMQNLQRDLENLRVENQLLKERLQAWQNYYAGRGIMPADFPPSNSPPPRPPVQVARQEPVQARASEVPPITLTPASFRSNVATPSNRMHTIGNGETLASIARRYNVKLSSLQSANPTIDAKRLRPGQAVIIPPR